MRMLLLFVFSFLLSVISNSANAQIKGDSATAAGGNFNTSRSRISWMGSNYRKEWNTPITVPLIQLSKEHGGLTPDKKGGGKQTKSLRLKDPNGREYTLRSIAKFITSKTFPDTTLQSEAAADLIADGISASYPYVALSIPVLAKAAGVPHNDVKLVYIPDDPALGKYKEDFANMLALYEARYPDSVKKVYNSDDVIEKLEKDNDNDVDQAALLKIRILDMFIMDLDRHEGQWSWGAYDQGKGKVFYPLAKDRDQAFYINRGILPGFIKGKSLVPQLEGFKAKAHDITRFNFAARNFDRVFLNQLSEQDWQQAVDKFVPLMTDAVIENALAQQPREIRDISSGFIVQTLKERRNFITAEVMQYYRFLAGAVDIGGSNKKELFEITRNDDGSVLVQVYKTNSEGEKSYKMYERKFDPAVTREIRLYGKGGEDKFLVQGSDSRIKIRMIGGDGKDMFENTTKSNGGIVYDRRDGENTVTGSFRNKMANDSIVNLQTPFKQKLPKDKDSSYNWANYKYPLFSVFGTLGFNPDDGIYLGPTFKIVSHGFRKSPYKSFHQFKGLYAFSTKATRVSYNNEFISVFGHKTDIISEIDYKGPNNTTNFFGYGMNSVYDKTKTGKFRYYRIRYDLGDITMQIRHRFSNKVMFAVGPTFQFYSYDSTDKFNKARNVELNPLSGLNQGVFDKRQSYFGAKLDLNIDTRNNPVLPGKGFNWNTSFSYLSGNNNKSYDNVSQLNTDFSFYVSLVKNWLVWANHTGFGVTMGDNFEFYQAQYLGSKQELRGYRRERFAGRSKFFNQTELRLKLANLKTYLFPASFGMFAFVDAGRVWVKNDNVSKMGTGFGGGFWIAPMNKLLISISYAVSSEDSIPLFGFGWKF